MHVDELGSPPPVGTRTAIEAYLHQKIPISAAMGVRVKTATLERVDLWLPLQPNINHEKTLFGGSAAAAATLAAWTLLHLRLTAAGAEPQLVVQRGAMEYKKPIVGDFEATCLFGDTAAWGRFSHTLARRGKARLTMTARLMQGTNEMCAFFGDFVALRSST